MQIGVPLAGVLLASVLFAPINQSWARQVCDQQPGEPRSCGEVPDDPQPRRETPSPQPQPRVDPKVLERQRQEAARQQQLATANNLNDQGVAAFKSGDFANAANYFQKALQYSPNDSVMLQNLRNAREAIARQAALQARNRDAAEAVQKIEEANQIIQANGDSWNVPTPTAPVRHGPAPSPKLTFSRSGDGNQRPRGTSHLFGTNSTPSNPDIGKLNFTPPKVPQAGTTAEQLTSVDKSGNAAKHGSLEETKRLAQCGFDENICIPVDRVGKMAPTATASDIQAIAFPQFSRQDWARLQGSKEARKQGSKEARKAQPSSNAPANSRVNGSKSSKPFSKSEPLRITTSIRPIYSRPSKWTRKSKARSRPCSRRRKKSST